MRSKRRRTLPYTKSLEIEKRLTDLLEMIRRGEGSADILAEKLGVSMATVARGISALRDRGNNIHAIRRGTRWCYTLEKQEGNSDESPSH
jgi:biotin operon repressor